MTGQLKTIATLRFDQITRERKTAECVGCRAIVVHVQVATYAIGTGFKSYTWIPFGHRRADGSRCTHLAEARDQVWTPRKK